MTGKCHDGTCPPAVALAVAGHLTIFSPEVAVFSHKAFSLSVALNNVVSLLYEGFADALMAGGLSVVVAEGSDCR